MLKNKSVAVKMLVSYLLILMIPVVAMIGSYFYIEKVFEDEVINSNQLVLSMLRAELDKLFEAQKNDCIKLIFSNNVNRMLSAELDHKVRWELEQQIQSELQSLILSNTNVDSMYVYFCNQDLAITSSAVTNGETLYHMYYDWGEEGYEKWRQFVLGDLNEPFYVLDNYLGTGKKGRTVTVLHTLPLKNRFKKSAVIAVAVQIDKIEKIADQVKKNNDINIAVLDSNNHDILGSTEYDFNKINVENQFGVYGDVFFAAQDSNITPWKYVLSINKKVLRRQIMYIRIMVFVCLLITIAIGILLSRKFTKVNYTPIERIMGALTRGRQLREFDEKNEYSYIFKVLEENKMEQDKFEKLFEHQRKEFRAQLFGLLLSGQARDLEKIKQSLKKLDVSFCSDQFVVVLIYLDDYKKLFFEETDLSDEKRHELYKLIVTNVVEEILNHSYNCCVFEKDLFMVALINLRGDGNDNVSSAIAEAMEQAIGFIEEYFSISLRVAVSNVHCSPEKLSACYYEANDTIIQMMVSDTYGVQCYSDNGSSYFSNWREQMQREEEMINLIRVGDSDGAKTVLEHWFAASQEDSELNQKILCGFLYHLASTVCNELAEQMDLSGKQWCTACMQKLIRCTTTAEMKEQMSAVIDFICGFSKKNGSTESMGGKIKQYVLHNYTQIDFNVNAIGEHFGFTPTYISRVFKNEYGEVLGNYIMRLRVERAKQLIDQTDKSLVEVAREVGYLDSKALARAFKKVLGILPSQYKSFSKERNLS